MLFGLAVFKLFVIRQIQPRGGLAAGNSRIFSTSSGAISHAPRKSKNMDERRSAARFVVAFPIRVKWKDDNGKVMVEEGLTENIGPQGTLIYLPRMLPTVGSKVELTVTENPKDEVTVKAEVIRLERNAAHPQAALMRTDQIRAWRKKVVALAAETVANAKPDDGDDW